MKDLEREDSVLRREGKREEELFVPYGSGGPGIVRFGGEAAIRVDPEYGVGL